MGKRSEHTACEHCSEPCYPTDIERDGKHFCCNGCATVYFMLQENGLCDYYTLENRPGVSPAGFEADKFAYLDEEAIINRLTDFRDTDRAVINLFIPQMHCISCIWLLENLHKLTNGIISSRVNFPRKELQVTYQESKISLRQLIELLASTGYEPKLNLSNLKEAGSEAKPVDPRKRLDRQLLYKVGVAGFSFGNVMLMSFPDYVDGLGDLSTDFKSVFGYLSIVLSLPVLFYSDADYLKSAYHAIRRRALNMDVPIALGITALFGRSLYEILTGIGSGYLDSFCGLIFFLLLGKFFQSRTYAALSFDRDYKSYFPVAVGRLNADNEKPEYIPINDLRPDDVIQIRNEELIPADSILESDEALIDYSFVTGEADPVLKRRGDMLYAGGRQQGSVIRLRVLKHVSQSYLTGLWNRDVFRKEKQSAAMKDLADRVGKRFTIFVLSVAMLSLGYWLLTAPSLAFEVFTAVLIVACPCALALSIPFTMGSVLRVFGQRGFYVKNTRVLETLADVDAVVFDKTGTLTNGQAAEIRYEGEPLSEEDKRLIKTLCENSGHPKSRRIVEYLGGDLPSGEVAGYKEQPGKGISATVDGREVKVGHISWFEQERQGQSAAAE